MFGRNKKTTTNTNNATWGTPQAQGNTTWDKGGMSDRPPVESMTASSSTSDSNYLRTPSSLLDLVDPVFQFICRMHRVDREGKELVFTQVRADAEKVLSDVEKSAKRDPSLQIQYDKIKEPIRWYIDYWFGSSGDFKSIKSEWNRDRMGEAPDDGDSILSGDEAFFDEVDKALKSKAGDEQTTELLCFYYNAIGLGFTGPFFKPIPEHQKMLESYMDKLYPRVQSSLKIVEKRVSPECYDYTDRRDFVAPLRDRPMILFLASLFLVVSIIFGYMWLYGNHKKDLEQKVNDVLKTSTK